MKYLIYTIPFVSLLLTIGTQPLFFKLFKKLTIVSSLLIGYTVGLLFLISFFLCFLFTNVSGFFSVVIAFVSNLFFFSCLFYCYFNYINIGEASLRIRLLLELNSKSDGLPKEKIFEKYNNKTIIDSRIKKLIRDGQIIAADNKYSLGKTRFLILANFFRIVEKVVMRHRKISLYHMEK